MRLTFFQKKALLISANLFAISFTLIGAGTATYAWFASQNIVTATGMSVSCAAPQGSLSYEILKYDDNQKCGVSYDSASEFKLPAYDQFITSKNYYCNAIIIATVGFGSDFTSANNVVLTITCNGAFKDSDNKIASNTSNVVAFKSFIYSYTDTTGEHIIANDIDTTSDATKYEDAVEKFNGISASSSFVNGNNKSTSITSTCNASGTYNATSVTIYFECLYNPTLVNSFIQDQGYHMEGTIDLADDIVSISIDKGNI